MRALQPRELIALWEKGQRMSWVDRGILLLRAAFPDLTASDLLKLTLGQRDACLLRLRELTMGPDLPATTECPHCSERLEFTFKASDVQTADFGVPVPMLHEYAANGFTVQLRPVTTADLLALRRVSHAGWAHDVLVRRVVLSAHYEGRPIAPESLPETIVGMLGELLAEKDAQSEILFDLSCARCGESIPAMFDIVPFFWRELSARAELLLFEVRAIAKAYGWTESEILHMSGAKRRFYLEAAR